MCSIIHLKPGQMIQYEMLENAVYNNWHSYGLVTKIDGKLDIKKVVPASGEVDPKEVFELLKRDQEFERFLHLRHNTAGATTMENTHPFDIFYDPKTGRQVVFMHNGTFHSFVSKKTVNGITSDDLDGPSDTKNFVDQILVPYLTAMDFGNGLADIQNPLTNLFIKKFWIGGNRGVLISSDQPALFIDDWKKVGPKDDEIYASNDTYFDKVTRGPEYSRRLARQARETSTGSKVTENVFARLQDFKLDSKHGFYSLTQSMSNLFDDWDVWDRSSTVSLGYASADELKELYDNEKVCLPIMDWVFTDYAKLYKEHLILEKKLEKATKRIASMVEDRKQKAA